MANKKFKVEDTDILNAIYYHTTGRPNMSLLEKIIFVADYIEPNRKVIPGLEETCSIAFQNLDNALLLILKNTLAYIKKKGHGTDIDPMTQKTYEYYSKSILL